MRLGGSYEQFGDWDDGGGRKRRAQRGGAQDVYANSLAFAVDVDRVVPNVDYDVVHHFKDGRRVRGKVVEDLLTLRKDARLREGAVRGDVLELCHVALKAIAFVLVLRARAHLQEASILEVAAKTTTKKRTLNCITCDAFHDD